MPRTIANTHNLLRMRISQRPPYEEVWHLWKVLIPRRSITGRFVRGTVLRRRDSGRWIYRQYTGSDQGDYRASAQTLIQESRRSASQRGFP
jgi:hypothetical protein